MIDDRNGPRRGRDLNAVTALPTGCRTAGSSRLKVPGFSAFLNDVINRFGRRSAGGILSPLEYPDV
jgi:hypothetical protein